MNTDLLIEAAGLVADGSVLDWGSMSSRLSTDEERALADELALVAMIAQEHRRLHDLLPEAVPGAAGDACLERATWGHLELFEVLGRGSYGTVYRAWDGRLDRQVALKLFHGARDPEAVMREGRMLAKIGHDNVVAIYGADVVDGVAGIWMEFVRGRNLDQIVKEQGPLSAQEATLVGLEISRALAAVHNAGLLHCDIKAQNVIREPGGRLVLMDLGAGRTVPGTGDTTAVGHFTGTPRYMAPEIFERRPASPQSDIYSLGVLLFYLVTGKFPVDGKTLAEIKTAHAEGRRQHLRDLRPDLPTGYLRAVTRATDPSPFERHYSAGELEAVLLALAPTGVVTNREARQDATSRKTLTVGAAVLAVVLAGGLLTWTLLPRGATGSATARSIAVLPIRNLTGDPAKAYLADGLTEVVISHLSRVRAFSVPSFAAVSAFRDQATPSASVAKPLGADLLLAGSVVDVGGRLGVVMHLIDPIRDRVLWAREFNPTSSDLLSAPAEIARQVAEFLSVTLSDVERASFAAQTVAPGAQDAYLRGLVASASQLESMFPEAVAQFETATRIEPSFAAAWGGWALGELRLAEFADPQSRSARIARAKELAAQALRLDPSQPSGHVALGTAQFYFEWDFDAAERSFRHALEAAPSNGAALEELARLLSARGRLDEAVRVGEEAVRIEPLVANRLIMLGMVHYYRRDYARATELMERSLQVAPDSPVARFGLGRIYAAKGQYDLAAVEIRKALNRSRNMNWLPELACVLAALGHNAGVESVLKELAERERHGESYSLDHRAHIAAAEGRLDEGFAILREAVDRRVTNVLWMAVDPRLDSYRADSRFEQLLRDAHLR